MNSTFYSVHFPSSLSVFSVTSSKLNGNNVDDDRLTLASQLKSEGFLCCWENRENGAVFILVETSSSSPPSSKSEEYTFKSLDSFDPLSLIIPCFEFCVLPLLKTFIRVGKGFCSKNLLHVDSVAERPQAQKIATVESTLALGYDNRSLFLRIGRCYDAHVQPIPLASSAPWRRQRKGVLACAVLPKLSRALVFQESIREDDPFKNSTDSASWSDKSKLTSFWRQRYGLELPSDLGGGIAPVKFPSAQNPMTFNYPYACLVEKNALEVEARPRTSAKRKESILAQLLEEFESAIVQFQERALTKLGEERAVKITFSATPQHAIQPPSSDSRRRGGAAGRRRAADSVSSSDYLSSNQVSAFGTAHYRQSPVVSLPPLDLHPSKRPRRVEASRAQPEERQESAIDDAEMATLLLDPSKRRTLSLEALRLFLQEKNQPFAQVLGREAATAAVAHILAVKLPTHLPQKIQKSEE